LPDIDVPILIIMAVILVAVYVVLGNRLPQWAMASCPVMAGGFCVVAVTSGAPEWAILAVVVMLITPAAVLTSRTGPDRPTWPKTAAKVLLLLPAVLLLAAAPFAGGGWFLVIAALTVAMVIRFLLISRHNVSVQVFSTIAASMRQNLPLPTALEFAAQGGAGKAGRFLLGISGWLSQGYPLSESLSRGYPQCPGSALATIAAAERMNRVPEALAGIEASLARESRQGNRLQPVNPIYPLVVVAAAMTVLYGMTVFTMPSFRQVFGDMGCALPGVSRFVFDNLVGQRLVIPMAVAALAVGAVLLAVYAKFRPRRADRPHLLSRVGDLLKWHVPMLHWFEWNYSVLQVASFLRLAIDSGQPLDESIAAAAELDTNGCYRKRLGRWASLVRRGQDVADAAHQCRVGAQLAWAFDRRTNPGNAPAVLEMLVCYYASRYGYAVNLARFIFWPVAVLALGAFVGLIAYAILSPIAVLNDVVGRSVLP